MRSIAGHRLLETLGRGATATVFRAAGPQGEVALKVARRDLPTAAARMAAEREVLRELAGMAGVVPLRDHGVDAGVAWLAMPVLTPPAAWEVDAVLRAIGGALAAAHARGWVHGDVAPGHVMAGAEGLVLIDWGSARRDGDARRDVERLAVAVCGLLAPGDAARVAREAGEWRELLLAMMATDPAARPTAAEVVATVGRVLTR